MRYTVILLISVLSLSFFSSCTEDEDAYVGRGLIINEFLASNDACCTDQSGDYDDWVELFNDSNDPIDIGGMYFTDTPDDNNPYLIHSNEILGRHSL